MSDDRAQQSLSYFSAALEQLVEALAQPESVNRRDVALLRFMLTYETAWKAIRWALIEKVGIETNGPKPSLQEAFRQGWLGADETIWLRMIQDRNLIVHTYNAEQAELIFSHIHEFADAFKTLERTLLDSRL